MRNFSFIRMERLVRNHGKQRHIFFSNLHLSAKNDEILDIRNRLRRNSQIYKDIPLYLDVDGSFLKSNFDFRIPPIMQTMLLNDTGSIAYVGNPLINNTIKEDILNIIKNKQNEKN